MKILLAVSGGSDSMYLACRASDFFPDAAFCVAHCNFSLRGDESDGDESFVKDWCAGNGMPCLVARFDTEKIASERGVSIEMAARDLRYEWFSSLCREQGFNAVAVAHNASDNAETFFLNLLRGAGSRGLKGMSEDSFSQYGCRVLRPMLGITREQIREYLVSKGQTWREDSSNAENEYKRNRLRNQVFPLLRELNPSFLETLREDMAHIAQVDAIAADLVEASGVLLPDGSLDLDVLRGQKHWKYVLWQLTEGRLGKDGYENLVEAIESGRQLSGKRFGDFVATKGRLVPEGSLKAAGEGECRIEVLPLQEISSLKQPEGVLLMDAAKIALPLKIRGWKAGDWIVPFGMKGRKKLSDLFVDLGWDERKKASAKVVEMEGSHVAALLFVRIDDSVKIDGRTSKVIRLSENLL